MTLPIFTIKPKEVSTPKLEALVKFPAKVIGTTGIEVTKEHGTYTIETDWSDFGAISAIPTEPTSYILTYDTATRAYVLVPSHLLGGAVAGIADAPNDGVQYGRQSADWTVIAPPGAAEGDYDTHATVAATAIASGVTHLRTAGYSVVGDGGGALYKKVSAIPTHPGKVQSADGAWWELEEETVSPKMFGGVADGTTVSEATWQMAVDYLAAKGIGGTLDLSGNWAVKNGIGISGISNLTIQSRGGRVKYLHTDASFYHLIRISSCDQVNIDGLDIWCDPALARNDTGFAIQITTTSDITISNCNFADTASNAIWIDTASDIVITGNKIDGAKAGGIQLSNGCTQFSIANNSVNNTYDDAIGVVQDTAGTAPSLGTITGNVINNILGGHGISLISCNVVTVSANTITNTAAAGIGSYIWSGTTDPAQSINITDNLIISTGLAPANAQNCCCIFLGGNKDCVVSGNVLDSPNGVGFTADVSLLRLFGFNNVTIRDNAMRNCANFGIHVPSGASPAGPMTIENNTFRNIQKTPIMFSPATANGAVSIINNSFSISGYSDIANGVINVTNMGSQRLYIADTHQIDQGYAIVVNTATCTNVVATDNNPAVWLPYTPAASGTSGGALGSYTAVGRYTRVGGMVYFTAGVNIITVAPASGALVVSLPVATDSQSQQIQWIEVAVTGGSGVMDGYTSTQVFARGGGGLLLAGYGVTISGWYSTVSY